MPKVLNAHHDNLEDGVWVDRSTVYGNPFHIGRHGDRQTVVRRHAEYVERRVKNGTLNLAPLRGRDLICWCAPEACHADNLLRMANE